MQQEVFEVTRERFHLLDENLYILQGNFPKECEAEAYLDNQKLETQVEPWDNSSVLVRVKDIDLRQVVFETLTFRLPKKLAKTGRFKI